MVPSWLTETPVTTPVHEVICPAEVPDVVFCVGVAITSTALPGERSGGNCPALRPIAAIALPVGGSWGEPRTAAVTNDPAGRLNATGSPITVDAADAENVVS